MKRPSSRFSSPVFAKEGSGGGGGQTANISNAAEFQVSVQFLQIHDFSEKQTLPKDYLIKDVDYTNFLRIVVWFIKNQIL